MGWGSMAWQRCLRAAAGLLLAACAVWPALAGNVLLVTENQPPLSFMVQEQVSGVSTGVVREMLLRAHLDGQFSLLPWPRAYALAQQNTNTCIYPIVRSTEREPLFRWVGLIAVNQWVLYAAPGFKGRLATLDDARPYRIGGTLRDAKSDYLRTQGFNHLDLVIDEELNVRKLLAGHIDLWIAAAGRAQTLIARDGFRDIRPQLVIGQSDQYLACQPQTPDAVISALTSALQSMRKDGTLRTMTGMFSPI